MNFVIITILLLVGFAIFEGLLLMRIYRGITQIDQFINFLLVSFYAFLQISIPLSWCLALLPPFNDFSSPVISGIGGAAFGLQYEYYPQATILFIATSIIPIFLLFFFIPLSSSQNVVKYFLLDFKQQFNRLPLGYILGAIFIYSFLHIILFYTFIGWDRLWQSDLGRFEAKYDTDTSTLAYIFDIRLFNIIATILALPLLLMAIFVKRKLCWGCILTVIMLSIPSLSTGSRRASIFMIAAIFILFLRNRYKIFTIIPFIVISYYLIFIPHVMRGNEKGTGLRYALDGLEEITWMTTFESLPKHLSSIMFNYGMGLPILVESLSSKAEGKNIISDTPSGYMWISFSPVPSLIDKYSTNYQPYHPRINEYSPYNAYAEAVSQSYFLAVFFLPVAIFLLMLLIRLTRACGYWGSLVALFLAASNTMGFLVATQYTIRTVTRFNFYTMEIGILLIITLYSFRQVSRREN